MYRRRILLAGMLSCVIPAAKAAPRLENFRFGILKGSEDAGFLLDAETTRLPRKLKHTGFRWGFTFENPDGAELEWYDIVHLPRDTKQVSGTFDTRSKRHLRTTTFRSNERSIVDNFWFDEGDPLGPHTLDLYVNDRLVHQFRFDVVKA